MARIQTNIPSLTGQHNLQRTNAALNVSLVRLSTGLRINTGKDDPAGLIASEILRSEIGSIGQSIKNSERANNIVATADAALTQVSTLLNDIRALIIASANKGAVSTAEIAANQIQVDSALESISRIGQTTVFGGDKLLNGTKSFLVSTTGGSLGPFRSTADIQIGTIDPSLHTSTAGDDIQIDVTSTATKATLEIQGDDLTANNGAGLLDLSLGTSTKATTTLLGRDNDLATNGSLSDLTLATATRATKAITVAAFAGLSAVTATTTFTLSNSVTGGSASITVTDATVAAGGTAARDYLIGLVNAQSSTTGIVARANGANVQLDTLAAGATQVAGAISIVGTAGDAADQALFTNGSAAVAATTAGAGATDANNTTFTLTGGKNASGPAVTIQVNNFAVINSSQILVDAINTQTGSTGIVASLGTDGVGGTALGASVILRDSRVGSSSAATITSTTATAGADVTNFNATRSTAAGVDGTSNTTSIEIVGDLGRAVVTVSNDSVINNVSALAATINAVTSLTGVTAAGSGHGGLVTLTSQNYGTRAILSANAISASDSADVTLFNDEDTQQATAGTDSNGTVTYGGATRNFQASGEVITLNETRLALTAATDPTLTPRTTASITLNNTALQGLDNTAGNVLGLTVTGRSGSAVNISVDSIALQADIRVLANAINAQTFNTGVRARLSDPTSVTSNIVLESTTAGAGSITITARPQPATTQAADVALFNGATVQTNLVAGTNVPTTGVTNTTASFDVSGGALFQIGPNVNFANQVNVNIVALDLTTLGRNYSATGNKGLINIKTGGTDVLSSIELSTAEKLVSQAISQITTLRGQLGSLQKNVLESNIVSQQNSFEQVTAAQSNIRDADFAAETASLTKNQILVQAGTSVLAIANSSPQNILALLPRG
jgi:flagellin